MEFNGAWRIARARESMCSEPSEARRAKLAIGASPVRRTWCLIASEPSEARIAKLAGHASSSCQVVFE